MKHETNEDQYPGMVLLAGGYQLDNRPMIPFSQEVLHFLTAFSGKIRGLPREDAGGELRSLAFWLRESRLLELKEAYRGPDRLGLGISFHIAPANVPLMFAYSLAIGLLAGNSCRVRISGRRTGDMELLCRLMELLLEKPEFQGMKNRISIVSYPRENTALTEHFSRECDARIVWGGDQTVEDIRRIPLSPSAVELVFPDRHSIAVMGAEAVLSLSGGELKTLARHFYNDTYAMDQNACSCPKMLFWQEDTEAAGKEASSRFWNALAAEAEDYDLREIQVSRKYGSLWELAGAGGPFRRLGRWNNRLYVLEAIEPPERIPAEFLKYGSFLEYHMKRGSDWTASVSEKTQTLTYFGVSPESLKKLVSEHRLRGIFRIVPAGQALEMSTVWDGKDLIRLLSRPVPQ